MSAGSGYWAATEDAGRERERLALLERRYDEVTFQRLRALGSLAGRACLEVGAGTGSVARWLADQVGPGGAVVATDLDPRFLDGLAGLANVEVRRHDIVADPVEEGAFDVVHCRALLCHLDDPDRALRRMASAMRPGGWLLVEDADFATLRAADPRHPAAQDWDRVVGTLFRFIASSGLFDAYLGRRLPELAGSLPLEAVSHDRIVRMHAGGSAAAEFIRRSVLAQARVLTGSGACTDADLVAFSDALTDPSFHFADATACALRGRRRA